MMDNPKMNINQLLEKIVKENASDLHCTVGVPPSIRKDGKLIRLNQPMLQAKDVIEFGETLIKGHDWSMKLMHDYDLAYSLTGVGRFRVNIYWQRNNPVIACRHLMEKMPSLEELGLPTVLGKHILSRQGLILVTGPTGHGKTTSLAAMVNLINEQKECNIITLEDPIEYVHQHNKSNINQREVGADCESFSHGLRRILRQDLRSFSITVSF